MQGRAAKKGEHGLGLGQRTGGAAHLGVAMVEVRAAWVVGAGRGTQRQLAPKRRSQRHPREPEVGRQSRLQAALNAQIGLAGHEGRAGAGLESRGAGHKGEEQQNGREQGRRALPWAVLPPGHRGVRRGAVSGSGCLFRQASAARVARRQAWAGGTWGEDRGAGKVEKSHGAEHSSR